MALIVLINRIPEKGQKGVMLPLLHTIFLCPVFYVKCISMFYAGEGGEREKNKGEGKGEAEGGGRGGGGRERKEVRAEERG